MLNCFCYTGGFTLNALAGRAESVLSVDSSAELFQKSLAGAVPDAGVDVAIVGRIAAADHPVPLSFPEGDYLKGLLLRRA